MRTYDIRAEFPDSIKDDFTVAAETLEGARLRAEHRIRAFTPQAKIEWRGLVAFVNRKP